MSGVPTSGSVESVKKKTLRLKCAHGARRLNRQASTTKRYIRSNPVVRSFFPIHLLGVPRDRQTHIATSESTVVNGCKRRTRETGSEPWKHQGCEMDRKNGNKKRLSLIKGAWVVAFWSITGKLFLWCFLRS